MPPALVGKNLSISSMFMNTYIILCRGFFHVTSVVMGAECYLSISPSVSMEELLDAASARLPTLRGLKYTDYNLMELGRCLSGNGGKYQVLYGRDEVCVCVCVCVCVSTQKSW